MTIREILKAHQKYKMKGALPKSLGDAYLMKHNPIFRNIRNASIEFGFKYTEKRFANYDALPLTQLPKILSKKTIPYCDNVDALREIEKIAPNAFDWKELPPLRPNYVMHESAHGVARELKSIYVGSKARLSLKKQPRLVFETLVEEAFANAVECMANVYSHRPIDDELLIQNAYINESPLARKEIRDCLLTHGFEVTFKAVLLGFLHANFLKTQKAKIEFDRVYEIAMSEVESDQRKTSATSRTILRRAFHVGLDLDPTFTIFTSSFCFRLLGLKKTVYEIVDFDFLKPFEVEERYRTWLSVMTAVVSL